MLLDLTLLHARAAQRDLTAARTELRFSSRDSVVSRSLSSEVIRAVSHAQAALFVCVCFS